VHLSRALHGAKGPTPAAVHITAPRPSVSPRVLHAFGRASYEQDGLNKRRPRSDAPMDRAGHKFGPWARTRQITPGKNQGSPARRAIGPMGPGGVFSAPPRSGSPSGVGMGTPPTSVGSAHACPRRGLPNSPARAAGGGTDQRRLTSVQCAPAVASGERDRLGCELNQRRDAAALSSHAYAHDRLSASVW